MAWICRQLIASGLRPAVVSRGYAARKGDTSDEAAELAILLPGVPHVADRDRVSGAATAARLGVDVVVLDDGFQHRRLHRNLDVVAVDASDPFGCGHLFPRGLLRERVCGLARADVVVLTRATGVDPDRRAAIRSEVNCARGGRPVVWLETEHRPTATRTATGGGRGPRFALQSEGGGFLRHRKSGGLSPHARRGRRRPGGLPELCRPPCLRPG